MKKKVFLTHIYYHGCINDEIVAENENEAIDLLRTRANSMSAEEFQRSAEIIEDGTDATFIGETVNETETEPVGPFIPRHPMCIRFFFEGGYTDIPYDNVKMFNGLKCRGKIVNGFKCNAMLQGQDLEGYLMLNDGNCRESSYIDIFTDIKDEEPEYVHFPITGVGIPEIKLS